MKNNEDSGSEWERYEEDQFTLKRSIKEMNIWEHVFLLYTCKLLMFAFVQYDDTMMMEKNRERKNVFQIKRELDNVVVDEKLYNIFEVSFTAIPFSTSLT